MRAALGPLCLVSPESIVMSKSVWQGGKFTALLQLRLALFHEKNKKKFFFKPRIWLLLLFVSSQAQFSLTSKCCERFAHHCAARLFFFLNEHHKCYSVRHYDVQSCRITEVNLCGAGTRRYQMKTCRREPEAVQWGWEMAQGKWQRLTLITLQCVQWWMRESSVLGSF